MLNTDKLDELAKKISQAIGESPAKDVEKNIKALLQSALQRLDLIPREEFESALPALAMTAFSDLSNRTNPRMPLLAELTDLLWLGYDGGDGHAD